MAQWLARWTPDRAVRVRALAGALRCVLGQVTLLRCIKLLYQVYKWVPANLLLGVILRWTSIPSRGE